MDAALWTGTMVGACLGLLHAVGLVVRFLRMKGAQPGFSLGVLLTPLYYALWTIALWALFGAYVLYLWLLGCVLYGLRQLRAVALRAPSADKRPS
ncbi:MAG TPA: hypothetical protein PJ986_11625 [Gammaproteobacteria bacterium]|nr:hypothetical protein [Gammaproteobacteria bacterium]